MDEYLSNEWVRLNKQISAAATIEFSIPRNKDHWEGTANNIAYKMPILLK